MIPEGHWKKGMAVVTGELQVHFQMWLWDVRAHPPFTPTLSSLNSSISVQPGGLTLTISNLQCVLLASASNVGFLFIFSIQDANGRFFFFWFQGLLIGAFQPFSSQTSLLNYLNFLKLKTLQTCFYFA